MVRDYDFFLKSFEGDTESLSKGGISLLRKVPDLISWFSEGLWVGGGGEVKNFHMNTKTVTKAHHNT